MPFDFNRQIIINNPLIWNEPRIITAVPNMGSNHITEYEQWNMQIHANNSINSFQIT